MCWPLARKGYVMDFRDLTPEQKERARACKTPEDILALAKEEGFELADEELLAIAGGGDWVCNKDGNYCWSQSYPKKK